MGSISRLTKSGNLPPALIGGALLFIGVALRLYHVSLPPYDFLAWRETQTLMVARNFYREGMNLLRPSVDWRTTYEVAPRGTVGGTELQVVPYLTAILYHVFGIRYWVGRVVPICFASLATWYFLKLAKRFYGSTCATVASLILLVSPYYLFCGRCQMPELFALAMSFAALYYLDEWLSTNTSRTFLLSAAFTVAMLLGKPQMGVMAFPMAFLVFDRFHMKAFAQWKVYLFVAIVGTCFGAYMWWTSVVLIEAVGVSFSTPGFLDFRRWLTSGHYYSSIITSVWLWSVTPPVCVAGLVGLFIRGKDSRKYFAHAWLIGAVSLFFLMPGGTAPNGYYQIILEPPFALLAARALTAGFSKRGLKIVGNAALLAALIWPFQVTARLYRPAYLSDYRCGNWVNRNTPKSALVLTSSPNPATLYFADRVGWTAWQESHQKAAVFDQELINKVIRLGASALAVPVSSDFFDNSYYRKYNSIRDSLYDNYACYKEDEFTVFFLNEQGDLSPPESGSIVFGTVGSRKYLRGSWGPNQQNADGAPFVTMGPENVGAIRFASSAKAQQLALMIETPVDDQTIVAELDGKMVGTARLPTRGVRAELQLGALSASAEKTTHTLKLAATKRNRDGVSLILYTLDMY